uniref:NPA domain-containing protein n=1 Tax=Heterorhabditis bacteriophora TaxID=37862 RepID=A0A1I7X520_HETBA
MYLDTNPVDQIETKFHEIVGNLQNESDRLLAGNFFVINHYGTFCRKIFRLVHFEPTDLTTWLTAKQKFALGEMIQNPNINDMQIYDKKKYNQILKMYEFFSSATGEQKEEASDVIETGCRHFIAHMFGDDNAEEKFSKYQTFNITGIGGNATV